MNALTPLALSNADLLQALADTGELGLTALARAVARDKSNLSKTLNGLAGATPPLVKVAGSGWAITDAGRRALDAIARAENPVLASGAPAGFVELYHAQIQPDLANARRDWNSEDAQQDLAALALSIHSDGLLHPLLVGPPDSESEPRLHYAGATLPWHRLIGGERRWRAIGMLIKRGDWPEDRTIPCRIRDDEGLAREYIALADNLQRRNLNPLEEAKAFARLRKEDATTEEIAARVGVTQRQVQMRLQLLELSEDNQARLTLPKDDPEYLSPTTARRILRGESEHSEAVPDASDGRPLPEVNRLPEQPAQSVAAELELTQLQELILVEVDHYIAQKAEATPLGLARQIERRPDVFASEDLTTLVSNGLLFIKSDHPSKVILQPKGNAYLGRLHFDRSAEVRLRRARVDAGMLEPVIEDLEEDREYATPWLNGWSKPKKLTPQQALALLEIFDSSKRNKGSPCGAEIRWDTDQTTLAALRSEAFIYGGSSPSWEDKRYRVQLGHNGAQSLERYYPDYQKAAERRAHLERLYEQVKGPVIYWPNEGEYANEWLNGPFELSPEIAKAKVEEEARQKRAAESAALMEEARAKLDEIEAKFYADLPSLSSEALRDRVISLLQAFNAPAPWLPVDGYDVAAAANGAFVRGNSRCAKLAVIALNVLAGCDAAAIFGVEAKTLEREAFENAIADRLRHRRPDLTSAKAAVWAADLVRITLETNAIEFGEDGWDWNAAGAIEMADDDLDQGEDSCEPLDRNDPSETPEIQEG
jgi:ParB/RepB/Spo0J family partition protein